MEETKLQEWINENKPDEKLIYGDGCGSQSIFIRDNIPQIFAKDMDEYKSIKDNIMVVSTHTSKSVKLPVFQVTLSSGLKMILRYNFHDWKVSVISPFPIECDFLKIFNKDEKIHSVYCEGFRDEWVFGTYNENNSNFTIEIRPGYYQLYTFFWLLKEGASHVEIHKEV